MESIYSYFAGIGVDLPAYFKIALILLAGSLLLSGLSRFIFRKQTLIGSAISSSITIIFIYILMVVILTVFTKFRFLVTPLPFASLSSDAISFFRFTGSDFPVIAAQLLSMIILAFLVNLTEAILPSGKNLFWWIFWRFITVCIGFLLHYLATALFNKFLPQGIILYAPMILLGILLIMLLTGALKFLVGLLLATVNPLIAGLYTFFFATLVGKQVTKAVLTTTALSGVIILLERLQIASLSLMPGALIAYMPFLLILIPVWYLTSK